MKFYRFHDGEEFRYFSSKNECMKEAVNLAIYLREKSADNIPLGDIELERVEVRQDKGSILKMLNQRGFIVDSEKIYTVKGRN